MKTAVRTILNELRRSIMSIRFLVALAICMCILYQPVFYLRVVNDGFRGMSLPDAIMSTLGLGYYVSAASLVCALTYSDSYAWERMSGLYIYYVSRSGRRAYIASKVISVAVSGGLTTGGSFAIFCAVQALLLAPEVSGADVMLALREAWLFFTYGATWALAGLGISALVTSSIAAVVMPFCITQGLWLLYAVYNVPMLNPKGGIALVNGSMLSLPQIACQQLIVALCSIAVFAVAIERSR